MLKARASATYSFGFATYLNVVDSEVIRITANACYIFPSMSHRRPHPDIVAVFECKDKKNNRNDKGFSEIYYKNTSNCYLRVSKIGGAFVVMPSTVRADAYYDSY